MPNKKINLALIFGGKSAEHEVSIQSAMNIFSALDKKKYDIILIYIDKNGKWRLVKHFKIFDIIGNASIKKFLGDEITFIPQGQGKFINLKSFKVAKVDVVFPILHGPFGEDGSVQGLFEIADVPYVGASILGSAVGMDKDVMKRLLRDAGVPITKFLVFAYSKDINFDKIKKELGLPFFVKPANLGSSVGINRVVAKKDFHKAVREAFSFDSKIIVEESIDGRELECSVLGSDNPLASRVGEVILNNDFYSYNAKYINDNSAEIKIPAKLEEKIERKIQELAIKTFKILSCHGMGRVDFFLDKNNKILVNEINTIPGFTSISMYPKLWEASGIKYSGLIDKLIELAFEKHDKGMRK